MTDLTIPGLAQKLSDYADQTNQFINQQEDWVTGTPTGGPNNDGRYPFTNRFGATTLVPSPSIAAGASSPNGIQVVNTFADIATTSVSDEVQVMMTLGYIDVGIGGAMYVRSNSVGARLWRTQSLDGTWWELEQEEPSIDQFGAVYDVPTFDSWPAIQGAIDWNEARAFLGNQVGADMWTDAKGIIAMQTATNWTLSSTVFTNVAYGCLGWTSSDTDLLMKAFQAAIAWPTTGQNSLQTAIGAAVDYTGDVTRLLELIQQAVEWQGDDNEFLNAVQGSLGIDQDVSNIMDVLFSAVTWSDLAPISIIRAALAWTDDRTSFVQAMMSTVTWPGPDASLIALVQAGINFVIGRNNFYQTYGDLRKGGVLTASGGRTYYCSQTIRIDPTRTTLRFRGCIISHSLKTFLNPATQPELLLNGDFAAGQANWTITENDRGNLDFSGGCVRHIRPAQNPVGTQISYAEFGQNFIAPKGSKIRIKARLNFIHTVKDIASNTPFDAVTFNIGRQKGKTGQQKTIGQMSIISSHPNKASSRSYTEPWDIMYDVVLLTDLDANPRIRIQSNCSFELESLSIKIVPDNRCMLIQSENEQYGHQKNYIEGFDLIGRTDQVDLVDGIVFSSARPLSSRVMARSIATNGAGIGRALVFENATYLVSMMQCRINARNAAIETLEGADDAGENLNFFGCAFGAPRGTTVLNHGMALNFTNCSFDFPLTWYKGKGFANFSNCWLEKNPNNDAQLATNPHLIWVEEGGLVSINGGRMQVDGGVWGNAIAPFRVDLDARLHLDSVGCSNMASSTNVMCVGIGYFHSRNMQGGSQMPTLTKRDATHNLFPVGDLEQYDLGVINTAIPFNVWIDSTGTTGSGLARDQSRYLLGWKGRVALPGITTVGSDILTGFTLPSGTVFIGDLLKGPGIPDNTAVTAVDYVNDKITMSSKAYLAGTGPFTYERPNYTGTATLTADLINGREGVIPSKSLKVVKSAGLNSNNPLKFNVAYPVEQFCKSGFEAYFKVWPDATATAGDTYTIFAQAYFVALDQSGPIPIVVNRLYVGMDYKFFVDTVSGRAFDKTTNLPVPGAPEWNLVTFTTAKTSPTLPHRGFAPAWATHVQVWWNLTSAPPCTVSFDSFAAALY